MSRTSSRIVVTLLAGTMLLSGFAQTAGMAAAKKGKGAVHKAPAAAKPSAPPADAKAKPAVDQISEDVRFTTLVDQYYDNRFKLNPTWATEMGVHDYDGTLEDYTSEGILTEAEMERSYRDKLRTIDPSKLNKYNKLDMEILLNSIEDQIFTVRVVETWTKNPDLYSSAVAASINALIKRDFAPLKQRMESVVAREEQIPATLAAAKKNLIPNRVPQVYAEVALEQLPGIITFFRESVPDSFRTVSGNETTLRQGFAKANIAAIEALQDYQKYIKGLVDNKQCTGAFALGSENYGLKLRYEQMIETDPQKLLTAGYDELRKQQAAFKELAQKLAPDQTPEDYFATISKDHPKADGVIPGVTAVLDELKNFCTDKNIVTIPATDPLKVAETPPFERALTFAEMDTPGPLEANPGDSFFYVTLPEDGWSAEKTEEFLRSFSNPDLINTSVHEAYPGHYVQHLFAKKLSSKVRKLADVSSNVEGWAHYCEQMMLDEGLHKGDDKLRLVQLHDALLRCGRYIVAIEMHCNHWTLDKAIDFLAKEAYMERTNAEREAKRGTMDPTYLVYTLGKMEILAMREDYKKLKGSSYSLKDFHDSYLKSGAVPLCVIRAELLNQPLSKGVVMNPSTVK